jgi:hypothetical protein
MGDPIYLANDHRGYPLKQILRERLEASSHDIARVLENPEDEETLAGVRREVEALCAGFPLHADRCSGPD